MAGKVYAVRRGKATGIFDTWEDCKTAVLGVSGAEYKSFFSRDEAEAYLCGENPEEAKATRITLNHPSSAEIANLFVVSGMDDTLSTVGVVIETFGKKTFAFYGEIDAGRYQNLKGIAGKLLAVLVGVQLCAEMGLSKINIVSSYEGIKKWYNGDWQAKGVLQNEYVTMMHRFRFQHLVEYRFVDVNDIFKPEGYKLAEQMVKRAKNVKHYINIDKIMSGTLTAHDVPLYSIT